MVHAVDDVSLPGRGGQDLVDRRRVRLREVDIGPPLHCRPRPRHPAGRILLDGENIADRAVMVRSDRRAVQLVSQNALSALNRRRTVGDALVQAMHVHGLGASTHGRLQAAGDLLERVGLRRDFRRPAPERHERR